MKTIEQLEAEMAAAPDAESMMAIWAEIFARQRGKPQLREDETEGGSA